MQSFRAIRFFDSGAQVSSGVPVIQQVRARMPAEWRAALLARDVAVITGVLAQIQQLLAGEGGVIGFFLRYAHVDASVAVQRRLEKGVFINPA